MTGEIEMQDLDKYRSLFPHVSAAIRLREAGKSLVLWYVDRISGMSTQMHNIKTHFAESRL